MFSPVLNCSKNNDSITILFNILFCNKLIDFFNNYYYLNFKTLHEK